MIVFSSELMPQDLELNQPEQFVNMSLQRDKKAVNKTNSTGDSSFDKGVMPQSIRVSFIVRFTEKAILKKLYDLARLNDENNKAAKFTVANETMDTAGINRVSILNFAVGEPDSHLQSWSCVLNMIELESIPDKTEKLTEAEISETAPPESGYNYEQTVEGIKDQFLATYYM